ncbi:MAG: hypothetical protein Mars2KO_31900 [Maribacter sp.]
MISFLSHTSNAQELGLSGSGNFEYSLVSGIGDTDLRTYNLDLGFRYEQGRKTFAFTLGYTDHRFFYFGSSTGFDESAFEKFHTVRPQFSYTRSFGKSWSVNATMAPTLSSNFAQGIDAEDFIPLGGISLSKTWGEENKISRLTFGTEHGILFGRPQWYPILSLGQKLNDTWSYVLGIPETRIAYAFNDRHTLRARAVLFGTYANNSRTLLYTDLGELTHTKLSFNGTDIGLEHNYDMSTGFTTVIRAGYQQAGNLEVLDEQDNLIHDFEPNGTIYITMGLKYKIN